MIKFEQSKLNKIDQYLKLYSRIFRFKKSYFEWLYIENPSENLWVLITMMKN